MGMLDGKVAIITGAGSGMGRAAVEVFVREGAKVVGADISGAEEETAAKCGQSVRPIRCDVTQEPDVERMVQTAVKEFGRVDAMLNVAGIADGALLTDVTLEQYHRIMNVDLLGVLLGMKHAIRAMVAQGIPGSVINFSSTGGINASIGTSVYSAAKAGVIALSKTGSLEYGAQGIRVNCICPGFTHTAMSKGAEDFIPGILTKASLNRGGQPEEMAEVAAFLASDRASYVSGAIIPVDGGWTAKVA